MNYLSVENLTKHYGEKLLFGNVNFGINKGQKVALIAKNGTGKTTLLNILTNHDFADNGKVTLRGDIRIGYLTQSIDEDSNLSIFDFIFNTDNDIVNSIRQYETALKDIKVSDNDANKKALEIAIENMETFKAWDFETRTKEMLHRFAIEDVFVNMSELSGGQRKKVALVKLLLSEADFLILDEPTNHLDIEMIEWLETYLTTANTTLLMVSHDRFFLDKVCNEIFELEQHGIVHYRGKYDYYLEKKQERILAQNAEKERAKNIYRKELEWIRSTPQARSTKAKARIENFEKIKQKAFAEVEQVAQQFAVKTERIGHKILEIEHLSFDYDNKTIVNDFSYIFKRGERCGIVGKNGSGKTTILKLITNNLKPNTGKISIGETVKIGYFSQDGLSLKNEGKRIIDIVKEHAEMVRMSDGNLISASSFLNHFGFGFDLQYNFFENLSGGQKRKLHLLMVLLKNPNFLILDEPTNDFDIETLTLLEDFLLDFQGCMLIVSHDRYFINKLVDHIFVLGGNGQIKDYYGNYSDYKQIENQLNKNTEKQKKEEKPIYQKVKNTNSNKRTYKEEKEFQALSEEIATLEEEKNTIVLQLNSGNVASDMLRIFSERYAQIDTILEEKTMRWFELSEKNG